MVAIYSSRGRFMVVRSPRLIFLTIFSTSSWSNCSAWHTTAWRLISLAHPQTNLQMIFAPYRYIRKDHSTKWWFEYRRDDVRGEKCYTSHKVDIFIRFFNVRIDILNWFGSGWNNSGFRSNTFLNIFRENSNERKVGNGSLKRQQFCA